MQATASEEAQVDFFAGPPTLDVSTGKYRRTHVFVMTLCFSRHSYEEAVFTQKSWSGLSQKFFNIDRLQISHPRFISWDKTPYPPV